MNAYESQQNTNDKSPLLSSSPNTGLLLQQKSGCGLRKSTLLRESEESKSEKRLQAKLSIGASNDPLEQEADRVAEQVLATPAHSIVSVTPPRIQRYTSQATADAGDAPPSVDRVLASAGRPLDPALQQDMGERFGHDFSKVRVHTGAAAEQSARDVNAHAYTVGRDIVFGASRFAPDTHQGRSLLAHELTHIVQQGAVAAPFDKGPIPDRRPNRRGNQMPFTLQRRSIFAGIAGLFHGDDFSDAELLSYLDLLDRTDVIEDYTESDNKARAIVRKWKRGDSRFLLTLRRKILLIREMLSGFTGDDDEQAILDLLRGSITTEFESILSTLGKGVLDSAFQGEEQDQLDALVTSRHSGTAQDRTRQRGDQQGAASAQQRNTETFAAETVVEMQRRFTSNAESTNRLNCIEIIRDIAPRLFASDPALAQRVRSRLGRLHGETLTMPHLGRAMEELGLASAYRRIRFNNGNGQNQPTGMQGSAWDTIIGLVGNVPGWHIFGLAVFDGYHSVTVLVENRPDGPRIYWADQWRIDPGDYFHEEEGSASGFRRYEQAGFDQFLNEYTSSRWKTVFDTKHKRYDATLHIWKFRSSLSGERQP